MISDDELRARLSAMDPLPSSVPVDPYTSLKAQSILERVMTTDIHDKTPSDNEGRSKLAIVTAAAAAVIALGIVALGVTSGGPTTSLKAKTTLALKIQGNGSAGTSRSTAGSGLSASVYGTVASCAVFNVSLLREMPIAFAGTVTAVSDSTIPTPSDMTVTLNVDHWYKGGIANVVTLTALITHALTPTTWTGVEDGIRFVQGKRYLLTATNGTVNGCGFSGEVTPELEKVFAEAFPR
ncbi:MAG TPA: hypothetical protein VMV52_00115 [Candidatus Nanopelagicaceae bacterium]|nr:hypothetical protein [Candidatus Nanopelagicaceae bacterium]